MQIKCPECDNAMSIGTIKPGRYQPKCKKCEKPFILLVAGDPPTIKIGKVKPAEATSSKPVSSKSASFTTRKLVSEAIDATIAGNASQTRNVEATMDASVISPGVSKSASSTAKNDDVPALDVPEKLGGYRIVRLLGRGAMGAVYEAKQISLDRSVALKTIRGRLAGNPSALARFTREAYAAAQLVHHNVVQIYDFGEDAGQHYFSMEWVRGGPLSDIVRDNGPVDPKVAATYTLQAARGLQFTHRHGMVHRDVKPANLLLNDEGVVKVADLGLVKVPDQPDPESDVAIASEASGMGSGTQVTMMGTAVGTPAYMAPEQGVDSTTVDHRADIYSLGCSLFYFLTGKAPFDGSQISEVMRKHAQAPIPDVQAVNRRTPESLARVIERSMAKRPEDRYASLVEMISDLEGCLGLQTAQGFSPSHQQADRWEELSAAYVSTPLAKLSRPAIPGFLAVAFLLLLLSPLLGLGYVLLSPAMVVTAILTSLFFGMTSGQSIVATRLRTWFGSLSWLDMVTGAFVGLVLLLVSVLVGLLPGLLIGVILGAAAAAAYHFGLTQPLHKAREATVTEAEKFVRGLRIEGVDEDKIRDFAARYSGKHWEPLFERLFGYDAMIETRSRLLTDPTAKANVSRNSFRDWVCSFLRSKTEANRVARDHKRLATLEEKGLKSEGLTDADAKERAWQMASAMIDAARTMPSISNDAADPKAEADLRRNRMKAMLAEARSGRYSKKRDKLAPLRFALSGKVRLLAGCLLLAMAGMWAYQNKVVSAETIASLRETATSGSVDVSSIRETVQKGITSAAVDTLTPKLLGTSGWAVGFAGLLVAGSAFFGGWRMSLFVIPAAFIAIFGPSFGVPSLGPAPAWAIACAGAAILMIPGVFFGEAKQSDY